MASGRYVLGNRLLACLSADDRVLIQDHLSPIEWSKGQVLFDPGEEVDVVHFPGPGSVAALVLSMSDGASAEAAMIGQEGAIGGVISAGDKPAFARAVVQIPGPGLRLGIEHLEHAKDLSPSLRDHFARYADCLLAQVLQSVACNAIHAAEARLARWLLTAQDRVGGNELNLTQDFIAEMLGVQRTYVTKVIGVHEQGGLIRTQRGLVIIADRAGLERQACECYFYLRRHFERLLPGVYPPSP